MRRIAVAAITAAACLALPAVGQKKPAAPAPAPPAVTTVEPAKDEARRIAREEAIKLVAAKKAVFVDVRPVDSYNSGHIKGAINIPESEITRRVKELPKGKLIITYCA